MNQRPHKSFPLNPRQWADQARATGPLNPDEPTHLKDQEESNAFIRDFLDT